MIWKNKLSNGLDINLTGRYHQAKTENHLPVMTGVYSAQGDNNVRYTYEGGSLYTGDNYQIVMMLASKRTPIQSFMSTLEVKKTSGNHDWTIGLNQWNYNIDKFATESVTYNQEVAPNPNKLIKQVYDNTSGTWTNATNAYGNVAGGLEYHNGFENKTALFFTDKWDVTDLLQLNIGARIESQNINGDYQDRTAIDPSYKWKDFRVWASARYFSKQYINKPNTLDLEARWETFAGANYKINKYFDVNVTVVNLLNQRGASGSVPYGDLLLTEEAAEKKEGSIMSGTYIRPFTVEFGVKFRF